MFDRYSDRARTVINLARQEAERLGHDTISTEHILLAILREGSGAAIRALCDMGIVPEQVRQELEKQITFLGDRRVPPAALTFSDQAREALAYAMEEATRLQHDHIGSGHLLLGLLRVKECLAAKTLAKLGVHISDFRRSTVNLPKREVAEIPPHQALTPPAPTVPPACLSIMDACTELMQLYAQFERQHQELRSLGEEELAAELDARINGLDRSLRKVVAKYRQ